MNDVRTSSSDGADRLPLTSGPEPGDEGFREIEASDVQGIERALSRLRKQYASAEAAKEGRGGTRLHIANLVIYAGSSAEAEVATATMNQIADFHPSRTILLLADLPPGTSTLNATVAAHCRRHETGRQICHEEIRLRSSSDSGERLRSIIDPLLISDLPVYFWWTGDLSMSDTSFTTLAPLSDRMLVDSRQFRSPLDTLHQITRVLAGDQLRSRIGDLNWCRLDPWRTLLAQIFDPPAMGALLPRLTHVRIDRAASAGADGSTRAQSVLLAGWLAARLGWEPLSRVAAASGVESVLLNAEDHAVLLELGTIGGQHLQPGDVERVTLQTDRGDEATVARAADHEHARISTVTGGAQAQERYVNFRIPEDAESVGQEMDMADGDPVFDETIAAAARLGALLVPGEAPR